MGRPIISNSPLPGDKVQINAEPGHGNLSPEFVMNRNASAVFGPILEKMNESVPRYYSENDFAVGQEGKAHESINMLMVKSSLANMIPQDNSPVKMEANGFPIADSPVRQRVDATRQMQGGGPVEEEPAEEGRGLMDYIHGGLDVAGMVPGFGVIPDIANAALYGGEALLAGDEPSRSEALALMGLSGAAAIPIAGQAATAGKWAVKSAKGAKRTRDILKQSKGVKYTTRFGEGEMDLSEKALGRLKKIYGGKYPPELDVTAHYPKVGSRQAYKAGLTPSGKEIPLGRQEGGPVHGYQDGGPVEEEGEGVTKEKYLGLLRNMSEAFGSPVREELFTPEGGYSELGFAEKLGFAPETMDIDTLSYSGPGTYNFRISGETPKGEKLSGTTRSLGMLPLKQHATSAMEGAIEDPFERLHYQVGLKNIEESLGGYKEGGQVKGDKALGDWGGEQGDYMKALAASRDSTISEQELKSMALMDHFRKMGTGERVESSDVYNGKPAYKSEEAYRRAFGMQTPLNAKERFTQVRLGLNPEMFTAQRRGLLGKALLQRLGNEVQ